MTIREQNQLNECQSAEEVRLAKALYLLKGEGFSKEEFLDNGVFVCHPYVSVRDEFGHARQLRPYYDHWSEEGYSCTQSPGRGTASQVWRMPLGDAIQWIIQSRRRRKADHGVRYFCYDPETRKTTGWKNSWRFPG